MRFGKEKKMIKIAHVREVDSLNNSLPQEVIQAVTEIATVLDNEYGVCFLQ